MMQARAALPAITGVPPTPPVSMQTPAPPPSEPTIDIPLKKGKKMTKISHLRVVGSETAAAAYKQAVLIAAKLIDSGLCDGETPICIADVYALAEKMKHLTTRILAPPIRRGGRLFDPDRKVRTDLVAQARLDGLFRQRWKYGDSAFGHQTPV